MLVIYHGMNPYNVTKVQKMEQTYKDLLHFIIYKFIISQHPSVSDLHHDVYYCLASRYQPLTRRIWITSASVLLQRTSCRPLQ